MTDNLRLPDTCVPRRYEIHLEPDLAAGTFAGTAIVALSLREPANAIVLNAAELAIHQVEIQRDGLPALAGTAELDAKTERATLRFPEALPAGDWRLRLAFAGSLNDKLRGFYRSRIATPAGGPAGEDVIAVTQFEATEARRAFPCWDEPAFKAVFQLSLTVPPGLAALTNTAPQSERTLPGGKRAITFAPTIPMSTYLVAVVIGRLEATPATTVGRTPLRVWCPPGKQPLARYAQQVAAFALAFFEDYYGIPYPGDKLDLIAIPDFAFGAMENLGAITFRETALLVDEAGATHAELSRVADVVTHELAHMWFGDLVTMAWWNGLWLNEAFATFMEVLAVDAWRPAWERWTSFGVSRAAALLVDGLASTRPVEYEVKAPKDADAMFDVLTYEKGGAVLRMLEQYLGPGVFRDGVRGYLARHRFGSADTIDLWRALGRAADQPIPELMDGWIFRSGYPLLRVALEPGGEGLRVSQERFRYLPLPHEEAQQRWQIPLRLRVGSAGGGSQTISRLLVEEEERIPLPGPADWVAVNADGHGFYRVRYAPDLRARLLTAGGLQAIERFNLLSDAWALALAGRERAGEFLDVTEHFREELDRNVWSAILAPFAYLARVIAPGLQPGLAALVRDRVGLAVERLGWLPGKGETELTRQLRGELLRAAGILGEDPAVQARAKAVLAEASGQPAAVEPAVLSAAIAVAAHVGGSGEYADFLERFKSAGTPQDEQRFLYALAGFREPSLVQQTLTLSIDGTVRTQDAPLLVRSLLLGVHSREAAWAFVKAHWDTMEARFPSQGGLRRMLEGITGLATRALESDVLGFLAARKVVLGGKTLEQYLEQLHIAVLFGEREAKSLHRHLGGPEA